MTNIQTLNPLLTSSASIQQIVSPPYDIVTKQEAADYIRQHASAILKVTRPDALTTKTTLTSEEQYQQAHLMLANLIKQDYAAHSEPCFLLYEIKSPFGTQLGLCCLSDPNHTKKHELTRPEKVRDRIQLAKAINCQISPVMLCTAPKLNFANQLNMAQKACQQLYQCHYQNELHTIYLLDNQQIINQLKELVNSAPIYIADGHHRSQMQYELHRQAPEKFSPYILSVIFPGESLNILGYHRLLTMQHALDQASLSTALAEHFDITKMNGAPHLPNEPQQFGWYINEQWFLLNAKQPLENQLAIELLHQKIISPLFNIVNVREDKRIDFIGGDNALQKIMAKTTNPNQCAFTVSPTTVTDIIKTADKGEVMPPKSTYFEPKLLDGLFLQN